MKRLAFALMISAVITGMNSCKKCGYCSFGANGNSTAVCKGTTLIPGTPDEYDYEKANCSSQNGEWVVVK